MSMNFSKILKDTTNQNLLSLLNDTESLSSTELMTILNLSPGMLNYHLKVLDEFLTKTVDDKYMLSEKGKQAYALLNDLPKSTGVSRRWKITWFISAVSVIVFTFFLWSVVDRPITSFIPMLFIFLFGFVLSYYLKVKPKITGRFIYIALGTAFLGCFLWLLLLKVNNGTFFAWYPPSSTGDRISMLLSVVICYVIGGVIGELTGKKMRYKWPPSGIF